MLIKGSGPWTGYPGSRAPRHGYRPFSVGAVNLFGNSFVGGDERLSSVGDAEYKTTWGSSASQKSQALQMLEILLSYSENSRYMKAVIEVVVQSDNEIAI